MSATALPARSLPRSRRVMFRVGLVLAGIMGTFNLINGVGTLIDPTFGQTDPSLAPQPVFVSVSLVAFGAITLAALVPAWKWMRWAIVAVIVSRLLEAWSAIVLPFLPDAPDGIALFVVVLIVVGTTVSLLVAQGLRTEA